MARSRFIVLSRLARFFTCKNLNPIAPQIENSQKLFGLIWITNVSTSVLPLLYKKQRLEMGDRPTTQLDFLVMILTQNGSEFCRPSMWFHHVSQTPGDGGYTIAVNYCKSFSFASIICLSSVASQYFSALLASNKLCMHLICRV